ncbi:MAG: hypothetical protein R3C05_03920 [Pirellulaceae bacterium]
MTNFLQRLMQRWQNWVGDADLERDIRSQLYKSGFYGKSAKFERVSLVAVQRPGWVQIYRFEVFAKRCQVDDEPEGGFQRLFGLAMDDGRNGAEIQFFNNADERRILFMQWSEGMIVLRRGID